MNKKFFVFFGIILCIIFSFTFCFAENNNGMQKATNDIRNFVGGVEDTVENAAKDVSNVSKDATGSVENGLDNDMNNRNDTAGYTTSGSDNDGGQYTASRVATDDTTLMGMTSTAWTWLIIGIAAIAIIAVVWYYSMQFTNSSNHHDDDNGLD